MIKVPAELLLTGALSGSAKLLWITHQLLAKAEAPNSKLLQTHSGLSRESIRYSLKELASTGWLSAGPAGRVVDLPDDLLLDHRLSMRARLLYGCIQLLPGYRGVFLAVISSGANRARSSEIVTRCETSYQELARLAGLTARPTHLAVRELQHHGWLLLSQQNKFTPVQIELRNPFAIRREEEVAEARQRLRLHEFRGEALMRELLSLIVDSLDYTDNASPDFLINPYTDQRMEFDRYYPPRVAFEYQGEQHFGPTKKYPDPVEAGRLQGRDMIKELICIRKGITLLQVVRADLSVAAMLRKVEGLLPLRDLDRHQPLLNYLEGACRRHRHSEG